MAERPLKVAKMNRVLGFSSFINVVNRRSTTLQPLTQPETSIVLNGNAKIIAFDLRGKMSAPSTRKGK